jgi:predicted phosphodiesterase
MRIAALYDIHGNLPALEAVLDELRHEHVDRVVIGGDVVPGPMPVACVERVLDLGLPTDFIRGNGDREVVALRRGTSTAGFPEAFRPIMEWSAEQLSAQHESALAGWPLTARIPLAGPGEVLFCHATPRSDTEIFTRSTPEKALAAIFAPLGAGLVVCGHTHMPFERTVAGVRIANPGSVGMPFGPPGAYWAIVDADGVHMRRTAYDLQDAARRIRATAYPQAESFAAQNVLQPPSEADVLRMFAAAEVT